MARNAQLGMARCAEESPSIEQKGNGEAMASYAEV